MSIERKIYRWTHRANQRMSTRIDLEVLSSFDFIITTSTGTHREGHIDNVAVERAKQSE